MAAVDMPECLDFLHFQDILKKMRTLDDKIVYTMNTLPTESFKEERDCNATCREIYKQLQSNYNERELAIQRCITYTTQKVQELKKKWENDRSDLEIIKTLKKEQGKVCLVEEVVRDKTKKVYYDRCRMFYVPPDISQ
ncbi:UNVERIFIED_CONTAM: hypothetical protein PYX00_002531 [Menopon gallinae]|uniref:Protein MIX23 n=1 Tax=Menopon gallinae TaxID=328185 RepID=A0AAW2IIH7_9NEOP